jgi:hypothetical protein
MGAQALPKPTKIERDATEEALTRGDTQPKS